MTRYRDFHLNCQALVSSEAPEYAIHTELSSEYSEAVIKQNMLVEYDLKNHILKVRWGASPFEKSRDCGEYILDIGEDGSIIGIEILEIYI